MESVMQVETKMKSAVEVVLALAPKIKSTVEVATEVEEANEMKTVMEVPTEWIYKESSNFKEISVKSRKWICMSLCEEIEIVLAMEATKEMGSMINIAIEVKTVMEVANEMKV